MKNSELSYEEKLIKMKERTGVALVLLEELPEERLNVYFNKTAARGPCSCGWGDSVFLGIVGLVCVSAAVGGMTSGDIDLFIGTNLILGVLLGGSSIKNITDVTTNEKIASEILNEISEQKKSNHPALRLS